jgi:hypothetical protein
LKIFGFVGQVGRSLLGMSKQGDANLWIWFILSMALGDSPEHRFRVVHSAFDP